MNYPNDSMLLYMPVYDVRPFDLNIRKFPAVFLAGIVLLFRVVGYLIKKSQLIPTFYYSFIL